MTSEKDHYQELIKLFLPLELFEYFEIRDLVVKDRSISVFLDERDIKPAVNSSMQLTSKGFHPEAIIQDFPLRNKPVFLHVRRRRWLIESTGEVVSRDWDSVAEGTRYTKSFADFLKGIFGQLPH